ncbi:hypothetical protein B0A50_08615 [Salinomyces thailandicus]|uniref:Domain of unknown function at the cortex 1 domain-containing protein n=1 Tax=Salinomyces thailandicus TaxID=706561 RepID=A0A4V5N305_9PEZI|nr:hypothetical protein B0A50_08615 [Salinomyces thailandica]
MASFAKRLSLGGSSSANDAATQQEADKYKLKVTAGPSYDQSQHDPVPVNTDNAVFVENDFLRAKVKVRIRDYHGLPSSSQRNSQYFDDPMHKQDLYSVAFSFVPKQDIPSADMVWGNDFDHPVRDRLPPGFNTAFKIVKEFIDPGLDCDAYADEPWLYGPSLSCWFAFRIGDMVESGADFPAPAEDVVMRDGGDGTGQEVREKMGLPENNEKRRKHFLSAPNREAFTFEKGRLYQADFYNPYIDFSNFSLKLPGFSLKVIKYVDQKSHCLRYVFKNVKTADVYLNVNIHLLWGQRLEEEVQSDRKRMQKAEGGVSRDNAVPEEKKRSESKVGEETEDHKADGDKEATAQAPLAGPELPRDQAGSAAAPSAGPELPPGCEAPSNVLRTSSVDLNQPQGHSMKASEAQTKPSNITDRQKQQQSDGVNEITAMLGDTSTVDKQGSQAL